MLDRKKMRTYVNGQAAGMCGHMYVNPVLK
jgi:hypothetical protein